MKTYIALIRGINVGGSNILPMKSLVSILEALGFREVKTTIQSGNLVFRSNPKSVSRLSNLISSAIRSSHGFEPQSFPFELSEFRKAVESNPYPEAESEPKTLHVFFLASIPQLPNLDALERIKADSERFALCGRFLYLHAPNGIGRSKLASNVEKLLGVPLTGRNWRTVNKILALAQQLS